MRTWITLMLAVLAAFAAPGAARAQTVDITLTQTAVSGNSGDTFTFGGSLTNLAFEEVEINGSLLSLVGAFTTDDSPFLVNAPFSLSPGSSSETFDMFSVQIDAGVAPGVYNGSFQVLGGTLGSGDANVLGTANFSVSVGDGGAAAVPEGDSLALVLGALPVMAFACWRRRVVRGSETLSAVFEAEA